MARGWRRSRRRGLTLLAALSLAGCLEIPGAALAPLPQTARLGAAGIEVTGPPGYCLDQSASRLGNTGAFAAFRRCDVLRGGRVDLSDRAVLGVSVSDTANPLPVVAGSEAALIAFFKTDEGRRVLSRSGDPTKVTVLQSMARSGVVWLQVRDSSPTLALDGTYWRAIFDLKGRIVTVTATGFAESPLPGARAKALAESLVTRIARANAGAGTEANSGANSGANSATTPATRTAGGAAEPNFNGFLTASPRL